MGSIRLPYIDVSSRSSPKHYFNRLWSDNTGQPLFCACVYDPAAGFPGVHSLNTIYNIINTRKQVQSHSMQFQSCSHPVSWLGLSRSCQNDSNTCACPLFLFPTRHLGGQNMYQQRNLPPNDRCMMQFLFELPFCGNNVISNWSAWHHGLTARPFQS